VRKTSSSSSARGSLNSQKVPRKNVWRPRQDVIATELQVKASKSGKTQASKHAGEISHGRGKETSDTSIGKEYRKFEVACRSVTQRLPHQLATIENVRRATDLQRHRISAIKRHSVGLEASDTSVTKVCAPARSTHARGSGGRIS